MPCNYLRYATLWTCLAGISIEIPDSEETPGSPQNAGCEGKTQPANEEGRQKRGLVLGEICMGSLGCSFWSAPEGGRNARCMIISYRS